MGLWPGQKAREKICARKKKFKEKNICAKEKK